MHSIHTQHIFYEYNTYVERYYGSQQDHKILDWHWSIANSKAFDLKFRVDFRFIKNVIHNISAHIAQAVNEIGFR